MSANKAEISDWWRTLPPAWQQGLYIALNGGAWSGDLDSKTGERKAEVVVYFVAPEFVAVIDKAIADAKLPTPDQLN